MSTISPQPSSLQVIGVIPARLASTRLPRKVLREIAGQPLLAWVYQAAAYARAWDRLIVAADSEEVESMCRLRGWEVHRTSPDLASGTDRVREIARHLAQEEGTLRDDAVFVNIQGDEPLLRSEHFHALLRPFMREKQAEEVSVSTVMTRCSTEEITNPNAVKVVVDRDGKALYFSRAPIPWDRDQGGNVLYWKHLGLYAYRRAALEHFPGLATSSLEAAERLEQLRFLENGISIHVGPVEFDSIGVDTQADLDRVASLLCKRPSAG